jgi:hypothetical protein
MTAADDYNRIAAAAFLLAGRLAPPQPDTEAPAPDDDEAVLHRAFMAWGERGDMQPLISFFQTRSVGVGGGHGFYLTPGDLGILAVLLAQLSGRHRTARKADKEKSGKAGRRFIYERWANPTYVATLIVEHRINKIKAAAGVSELSAADRAAVVEATSQEMEYGWHFLRGKPKLDRARMMELLRGPRSRRLGFEGLSVQRQGLDADDPPGEV